MFHNKYNYQKLFNRVNKELGPDFLESIYQTLNWIHEG